MKLNKLIVLSTIAIFGVQLVHVPEVQAQANPTTEQEQTKIDFDYTETAEGVMIRGIKKGEKIPANLVIPATINDKPVRGIDKGAFQKLKELKTVKFAENPNLKMIGFRTFYYADNLESVDLTGLSGLETVGEGTFEGTKLKELDLSANDQLKEIGYRTFYDLKTLKKVTFPQGKKQTPALETIGQMTFSKTNLETIDLSSLSNLKKVGDQVFELCPQLKEVTFPTSPQNNLEEIGDLTFAGSNDKSLYNKLQAADLSKLPKLKKIGRDAFRGTEIKEVKLPKQFVEFGEDTFADRKNPMIVYTIPQNLPQYFDFVKGSGKEQFQKEDIFKASGEVEFYDKETMEKPVIQKQENQFTVKDEKLGKFKLDGIPSLTAKGGYDGVWVSKDGDQLPSQLESDTPYAERYTENYQWIDVSQLTKEDLVLPDLKTVYNGEEQPLDPDRITFNSSSRFKDVAVPIKGIQYLQNETPKIPRNAGGYTVRVILQTNGEPQQLDYEYQIDQKSIMINGVTAVSRPENGSKEVELNGDNAELLGLAAADQGEVGFELGVGYLNDPYADKQKLMLTDIKLVGEAAGNYTLVQPNLKVDITAKPAAPETKPSSSTNSKSSSKKPSSTQNAKKMFPGSSKKITTASSTKAKNIPKTGAVRSWLPAIIGLALVGTAVYLQLQRKKGKKE